MFKQINKNICLAQFEAAGEFHGAAVICCISYYYYGMKS